MGKGKEKLIEDSAPFIRGDKCSHTLTTSDGVLHRSIGVDNGGSKYFSKYFANEYPYEFSGEIGGSCTVKCVFVFC